MTAKRPTRFDRFMAVFPFLVVGGAAGALALWAEARFHGTVLLVPTANWSSRRIPGGQLQAPDGSYSLSFTNTRLDWRLFPTPPGAGAPALVVGALPGWRLEVRDAAAGTMTPPEGEPLTRSRLLRVQADGSVKTVVTAGAKDVSLHFIPSPPDPRAYLGETARADMDEVARSLKPAAVAPAPGRGPQAP